jgi:hypothetical protein
MPTSIPGETTVPAPMSSPIWASMPPTSTSARCATSSNCALRTSGSSTQTYGLTLGYFNTWGSHDAGLYAPEEVAGSANGRPDSAGYVAELSYVPFGKDKSFMQPWLNMRFALQYVGYTRFNGGDRNYDGFGRDAADNNTVFLDAWLIF